MHILGLMASVGSITDNSKHPEATLAFSYARARLRTSAGSGANCGVIGVSMKIVRAVVSLVAGISCMSIAAYATDPLPRSVPEEVGMSSDRLALIGKAVNAEIAAGQLPGAVVGIVRRGKLVFFEAFGYRD